MGKYDYEALADIDIVEYLQSHGYELHRSGPTYRMSCPLGTDTDPSLQVDPRRNKFYCWHCGGDFKGDIVDFIQEIDGIDRDAAMAQLAEEYPFLLTPTGTREVDTTPQGKVTRALYSLWKLHQRDQDSYTVAMERDTEARDAISASRGIDVSVLRSFGVGITTWGKSPRISFPNTDEKGHVISFTTRTLVKGDPLPAYMAKNIFIKPTDESPYYERVDENKRNEDDTLTAYSKSEHLFHVYEAARSGETIYIVEGHFDVVALAELGFAGGVAMGTARISDAQLSQLRIALDEADYQGPIVFVPDNDDTGLRYRFDNYLAIRAYFPDTVIGYVNPGLAKNENEEFLFGAPVKDVGDLCAKSYNDKQLRKEAIWHLERYSFMESELLPKEMTMIPVPEYLQSCKPLLRAATEPFGRAALIEKICSGLGLDPSIMAACLK